MTSIDDVNIVFVLLADDPNERQSIDRRRRVNHMLCAKTNVKISKKSFFNSLT